MLFMAIPLMLFVVLFRYVPLFGWSLSLFDFRPGTPIFRNEFVGLKHFGLIITDRTMLRVMKNTLVFAFASFLLQPLPMIFAMLLNEVTLKRFKKFVQTVSTFPHFISWIIVYSLAFSIFSTEGALNNMLIDLGLIAKPTNLLGNPDAVYWFQVTLYWWKVLGWSSIIYIAAITTISPELYEVGIIDGANRFHLARYITLPSLMPTFVVLLILSIGNFVNIGFEQYFIFKNALVYNKIEVIELYTYRIGLQLFDYSYATAVGIFKSAISLTLLFGANAIAKHFRGTAIV